MWPVIDRKRAHGVGCRDAGGFTLLELTVVIVLVSILFVTVASRLWSLRVDAERVAMMQVLGTINSAIGIKLADSIARGDMKSVEALAGMNPMDLLAKTPENYVGVVDESKTQPPPGSWYFDTHSGALVYRVRYPEGFSGGPPGAPRARFALHLIKEHVPGYGGVGPGKDVVVGVRLDSVEPYRWAPP